MSEHVDTDKARINIRLRQSTKELIERAARFKGKTLSNFILSSAVSAAEKTVIEHDTIRLNATDALQFFAALSKKVTFNDALIDALGEHEERVTSN